MTSGTLLFGRGGVPLKKGGETVGAIGVSGATSGQDEAIALAVEHKLEK